MKVKIPLDKLKEFVSLSNKVPTDNSKLTPVLEYALITVDFDICTIIKSNNRAFCRFSFALKAEDCSFLVDLRKLDVVSSEFKGEYVTFNQNGSMITMSAMKQSQKSNNGEYTPELFPQIPDEVDETIKIPKDVVASIPMAKVVMAAENLRRDFGAVYLDGHYMYSSDLHRLFIKEFTQPLPFIPLESVDCDALMSLGSADYAKSGNYNTYKSGNVTYGFVQSEETRGFPFQQFLQAIKKERYLKLKRADLISFCSSTIKFADSEVKGMCFSNIKEISDNEILISFLDDTSGDENNLEAFGVFEGEPFDIKFNPSLWLPVLKSLPYEDLFLSEEGHVIGLWNDKDKYYTGMITKMV